MTCTLTWLEAAPAPARFVVAWGEGLGEVWSERGAAALTVRIAEVVAEVAARGAGHYPADRQQQVRKMLRHGRYRPTGRAKPASEYLFQAACQGDFPRLLPVVDVNNLLSLESGLPISIFDAALVSEGLGGRWGVAGEGFVFNPSGQRIAVDDLLVLCRRLPAGEWEACGSPVKDAQVTKVGVETRRVVGVVYVPVATPEGECVALGERFAEYLRDFAGCSRAAWALVG